MIRRKLLSPHILASDVLIGWPNLTVCTVLSFHILCEKVRHCQLSKVFCRTVWLSKIAHNGQEGQSSSSVRPQICASISDSPNGPRIAVICYCCAIILAAFRHHLGHLSRISICFSNGMLYGSNTMVITALLLVRVFISFIYSLPTCLAIACVRMGTLN